MCVSVVETYPRNRHGYVRQCAWCRRVADRAGVFRLPADGLLESATHGCCRSCLADLRATVARRRAGAFALGALPQESTPAMSAAG